MPSVAALYIVVAIFGHIFLTRLRPGWHVTAIGGSRRSAYNSGIPVRRTIALCYVASGALTAVGALFFAARLGTVGGDIGVGLEVVVLTATVLGALVLGEWFSPMQTGGAVLILGATVAGMALSRRERRGPAVQANAAQRPGTGGQPQTR